MAAVLPQLGLAVELAQVYQAARQPVDPLAVHSAVQDRLVLDQQLQDLLMALAPVDSLDNQVGLSVAMAFITPVPNQDITSVGLQDPLDPYHPASASVAELEAPALLPPVDLEAPISALDM